MKPIKTADTHEKEEYRAMKTMFTFTISILLGGALCLALVQAGIITPTKSVPGLSTFHLPTITVGNERRKITQPPPVVPLVHLPEATAPATSQSQPQSITPASRPLARKPQTSLPEPATGNLAAAEQIITFLDDITPPGQNGPSLESRLTTFMRNTLKIDAATADRLLRMCCWKHFVSLQGGIDDDRQALFTMEKRLKAAGFAAQGLTLLTIDLEAAEARMKQLADQQETSRHAGTPQLSEESI